MPAGKYIYRNADDTVRVRVFRRELAEDRVGKLTSINPPNTVTEGW